ncbi:hypothetical protein MTO96_040520 [Rhipicephalus appendiculatus]
MMEISLTVRALWKAVRNSREEAVRRKKSPWTSTRKTAAPCVPPAEVQRYIDTRDREGEQRYPGVERPFNAILDCSSHNHDSVPWYDFTNYCGCGIAGNLWCADRAPREQRQNSNAFATRDAQEECVLRGHFTPLFGTGQPFGRRIFFPFHGPSTRDRRKRSKWERHAGARAASLDHLAAAARAPMTTTTCIEVSRLRVRRVGSPIAGATLHRSPARSADVSGRRSTVLSYRWRDSSVVRRMGRLVPDSAHVT